MAKLKVSRPRSPSIKTGRLTGQAPPRSAVTSRIAVGTKVIRK